MRALGNSSVQPLTKAGDMSMLADSLFPGSHPRAASSAVMAVTLLASRPSATARTLRLMAAAVSVM